MPAASRELRFAARRLGRTPGFALAAILTVGAAIGACTAVYSIVYGVVLRPLPYPHPQQLVQLEQVDAAGRRGANFSDPNFEDVRGQTTSFAAMAEFNQFGVASVLVGDTPVRARAASVSHGFFAVMATEPATGRPFSMDEAHEGGPRAVIVSQGFWRTYFGPSRDLSGARVQVNGELHTVVGVMPAEFAFPPDTDVWLPREVRGRNPYRTGHNWRVVARLRDGVSIAGARADATLVARRLKAQYGDGTMMSDVAVLPLQDELVGNVRPILLVLLAAVGLLLMVACANLANVLLARLSARRHELAIRAALGASGGELLLPLVAEAAIVSASGGALGIAIASLAARWTALIEAADLPHVGEITVSWPVWLFAIGLTSATALALSLLVAWHDRRVDIVSSLKDAQRGHTAGGVGQLRNALVIAQLVVSVVLLVGAGLLGRSLIAVVGQRLGFRTTGVLTIEVASPAPRIQIGQDGLLFDDPSALPRQARLNEAIIARLAALPGVEDVGGISTFPLTGAGSDGVFAIVAPDDHTTEHLPLSAFQQLSRDASRVGSADFRVVSAGYFRTMGIPLVRGRLFDDRDGADAPHAAVISETLARSRWPNQDPIGTRIEFGGMDGDMRTLTVVGIVGDVRERGFDATPRPMFYADERQRPLQAFNFTFVVRTAIAPTAVIAGARQLVHELAPAVPPHFRTVADIIDQSVAGRRFTVVLVALFAGGALLVAVLGIYGVIAFLVAQRAREFGIRMALGAQRWDVQRLVLGQAARLVTIGLGVGVAIALGAGRVLRSQLFGVGTTDLVTYVSAVAVLALAALLACELPAMRAARVDPARALRADD